VQFIPFKCLNWAKYIEFDIFIDIF
jgi:hypothetical protein